MRRKWLHLPWKYKWRGKRGFLGTGTQFCKHCKEKKGPCCCKTSRRLLLVKKGDVEDLSNYRPVTRYIRCKRHLHISFWSASPKALIRSRAESQPVFANPLNDGPGYVVYQVEECKEKSSIYLCFTHLSIKRKNPIRVWRGISFREWFRRKWNRTHNISTFPRMYHFHKYSAVLRNFLTWSRN